MSMYNNIHSFIYLFTSNSDFDKSITARGLQNSIKASKCMRIGCNLYSLEYT